MRNRVNFPDLSVGYSDPENDTKKSRNNTFRESNTNSNDNHFIGINPRHSSNNRASRPAIQIRNNFVQYFQEKKFNFYKE